MNHESKYYFPPSCFIKAEALLDRLLITFEKNKGSRNIDDSSQFAINMVAQTVGCEVILWLKGSQVEKSSKPLKGRFRLYLEKWLHIYRPDKNSNNTINLVDINLPESDLAKSLWIDLSDSLASSDEPAGSLLFYNIRKDGWLDEGSGVMAKAFIMVLAEALESDITKLKFKILDKFRSVYSYVSASMYEQRFEYFKKELRGIELHFEPIIRFSPSISHFNIWGVEALARKKGKAPVEVFRAAENWGIRFQTELDMYILNKALATYRKKCNEGNFGSYSQLITITINVYPNTLLREAYRNYLLDLIKKYRIQGDKVIIEISEKEIIYSGDSEDGTLEKFNRVKNELKKRDISFAIDDFGAGNSSISRVLKIRPDFIKIDRNLLLYGSDISKRIIRELTQARNKSGNRVFNVVIEGLDEITHEKVSLFELINELSVEFVQGYLFGHASKDIAICLDESKHIQISKLLGWENVKKSKRNGLKKTKSKKDRAKSKVT